MTILFLILLVIACAILGLMVLIQNPKGGGLSGSLAGFNNQFMGVKQTNDVLERGTWIFAIVVGVLCIISSLFFTGSASTDDTKILQQMNTTTPANTQPAANPSNTVTLPPVTPDSTK